MHSIVAFRQSAAEPLSPVAAQLDRLGAIMLPRAGRDIALHARTTCKRHAIDGNVLADVSVVDEMFDVGIAMLLLAHGVMGRKSDPARHWFVLWQVLYARADCAFLIDAA